ncbi:PIN domain-containing protein [Elizabethkingia meningoseptica]|uniref:PIN domain-containing protein n=1 Tax=Elizabethkingia meningoseptica TaxID=238 RepID=UPI002DD62743|nr:PIN domain-containing protein [Elizabethkingia meningoseptica]MEC4712656.1 PIN domain-containing protein [Elizabethkingia meningoseptica]
MKEIKSILLDNSFVTRLLKSDDEYHKNVVDYFKYFIEKNIVLYLSTIVISEYAVADNPDNLLSLNSFQILEFDYGDAKISGDYYALLKDNAGLREMEERKVIINDLKLFAQIKNRGIDAFITKDRKALPKMIKPLKEHRGLHFEYFDLTIPLRDKIGLLF